MALMFEALLIAICLAFAVAVVAANVASAKEVKRRQTLSPLEQRSLAEQDEIERQAFQP